MSKRDGGVGINKSHERNIAFLAKLYWRVLKENAPWTSVCKYRLGLKSCNDSIFGKALLLGKVVADKGSFNVINNGRKTLVWFDNWNEFGTLLMSFKVL